MKKTIGVSILMCISLNLIGQNSTIDSLLNLLKTVKEDTNKVNVLYQLSEECDEADILKYAEPALHLAKKLNFKRGIANSTHNIGYMYYFNGNSNLAMEYFQESLAIRREIKDSVGLAESLYAVGGIFADYGDYFKALELYQESLNLYEKSGDKNLTAALINSMGFIYRDQGDVTKALDCFFKSLKIKEETGNKSGVSNSLRSIGAIYMIQRDFPHAEECFQKSLSSSNESGDNNAIAQSLNTLGDYFQNRGNFQKALEYFQKSIKIQGKNENRQLIAITLNNIGVSYRNLGDNNSALENFGRSLKILEEIGDKSTIAATLNNIGNTYRNENDLKQSEYYSRKSLEISIAAGIPERIRNASESLSKVYMSVGKFKEAFDMHVLFKQMADSINNQETQKSLVKKQMTYEFEKKEAVVKAENEKRELLSNAEIHRQKLIRNSTLGGVGIVGIFSFLLIRSISRKRKTAFEKQVAQVETKALRSQMNPHFIFNSLNSIDDYILNNDIKNSSLYVNKFSRLMRLILESSRKEEVSLKEDLESLELYMQLENLRMQKKVECTIEVSSEINTENVLIPPMLLQPFIENSFKHAFHGINSPKLEIQISLQDEMLHFTVTDNGKGRVNVHKAETETKEKRQSLGMTVTRERLDIISKIKRSKAYFAFEDLIDIQQKSAGTRVLLTVPATFAF